MKLGDFVHKLDLNVVIERIKNMPEKDMKLIKAKSMAIGFVVDLANEMIEAPMVEKMNLTPQEHAMFTVEVLAGIASVLVSRFAVRTNDPEAYINTFKSMFQMATQAMGEITKCQ